MSDTSDNEKLFLKSFLKVLLKTENSVKIENDNQN